MMHTITKALCMPSRLGKRCGRTECDLCGRRYHAFDVPRLFMRRKGAGLVDLKRVCRECGGRPAGAVREKAEEIRRTMRRLLAMSNDEK